MCIRVYICECIHNHWLQILTWCHIHTHTHMKAQTVLLPGLPEVPEDGSQWKRDFKLRRSLAKKLNTPGKQRGK